MSFLQIVRNINQFFVHNRVVTIDVKSLVPFSPVRTTRTLKKCAIARRVFWNRVI